MDNIGDGNNPVVLGDQSYWATRLVADSASGIQVVNEAPGLVENGKESTQPVREYLPVVLAEGQSRSEKH